MVRVLGLAAGVVMFVLGLWSTLQGLGYVGASSMSDRSYWAAVGPALAGLGVALIWVVARARRR